MLDQLAAAGLVGRNPFQGGVGFSTKARESLPHPIGLSQSLSGWGGVFNFDTPPRPGAPPGVAIPFRVGWGFQREQRVLQALAGTITSQSLSGWGGVFNRS